MTTSDQQNQGPLTRKQLREIRLTGATPVISAEEAAASAAAAPPLPRAAERAPVAPAPVISTETPRSVDDGAPLTRRQVRDLERTKSGSVPTVDEGEDDAAVITSVPSALSDDADDDLGDEVVAPPVSSSGRISGLDEASVVPEPVSQQSPDEHLLAEEANEADDAVVAVAALGIEVTPDEAEEDDVDPDDVFADADEVDDSIAVEGARPTVSSAFGEAVLADSVEPQKPFVPSFDELLTVGDSTRSHHTASNTLIFTPSPGDGSLSGPVASTGEILITGSYELPKGLGSQGHAHGTTDGKEADAVLIDGELAPASSPTPVAASAAISTIKPAGEIIRPPAPEKGNKLMLTLAIVAGGLALALGVALIIAFTTNVF